MSKLSSPQINLLPVPSPSRGPLLALQGPARLSNQANKGWPTLLSRAALPLLFCKGWFQLLGIQLPSLEWAPSWPGTGGSGQILSQRE